MKANSHEILVGLQVIDNAQYQQYREAMRPILISYGGRFIYDFNVSDVLKPDNSAINRVFTINFPNLQSMDLFFADPKYVSVKQRYFEESVGEMNIIASYPKAE